MSMKQQWWMGAMLGCVLVTATVQAEPSRADRATAETLFENGTELMTQGKFAQACEKFEGSLELDAALGTMLRLADCYDRIGRTASAWALFQDAASEAHAHGEPEREQMAHDRVAELEPRLSRVKFENHPRNAGLLLTIRIGDSKIPRASLDAALPLDPGLERIEVSAPGHLPFQTTLEVKTGPSLQTLDIPALASAPVVPASTTLGSNSTDAPSSSAGSAQRTLGWVTGGVGLAALGAGGFFAYRAHAVNQESLAHCRPQDDSACDATGVEQRNRAQGLATAATVTAVAGGAFLAGGIVLVLTAPSGSKKSEADTGVRLVGSVDAHGGGMRLFSRW
jgi:hypothetical protein